MEENCTTQSSTAQTYEIKIITTVYIVCLIPSVVGSFSVLLVSLLRWRNLQEQRHLLVQLALADFLASALLLSAIVVNVVEDTSEHCFILLPLALVFYILSFILVIVYAHESKNVSHGWRTRPDCESEQSGDNWSHFFFVFLWFFFVVMSLIYVLTGEQHMELKGVHCRSCLLFRDVESTKCPSDIFWYQESIYVLLFAVTIGVILWCTVIYHRVSSWYQTQQQRLQGLFPVEGDGQSRRRFKRVKSTTRGMVVVIVICWSPALLLFVLTFFLPLDRLLPLYVIQAVSVSLQGFFNSVVYAWNRPNFTDAVRGERTPLIGYHHMAFFDESIKTSV